MDAVAVPMPIGDRIGGFILLGSRRVRFSEDDRRLATTLTIRAGSQLASAHAVALSQKESARYSVMNELVKEASGKTMQEALDVVLERGKEVIRYDAGQAVLFQPNEAVDEPLLRVRNGETVLRNAVTEDQRTFSGLRLDTHAVTVNEALTPIRGKTGVIGALCLGRRGTSSFTQHDIAALDELGSMAGVAVENSRILQVVTGQASRLDTALDALGEVSQALTTVTQGPRVLEQKTLETAVRDPETLRLWYHDVINLMASTLLVNTVLIKGLWWREIDTPQDLTEVRASFARRELTGGFRESPRINTVRLKV